MRKILVSLILLSCIAGSILGGRGHTTRQAAKKKQRQQRQKRKKIAAAKAQRKKMAVRAAAENARHHAEEVIRKRTEDEAAASDMSRQEMVKAQLKNALLKARKIDRALTALAHTGLRKSTLNIPDQACNNVFRKQRKLILPNLRKYFRETLELTKPQLNRFLADDASGFWDKFEDWTFASLRANLLASQQKTSPLDWTDAFQLATKIKQQSGGQREQ